MFVRAEDWIALALLILVFPLYNLALPLLRRVLGRYGTGKRAEREIES